MTFSKENKNKKGSFKLPYSFGLPSYKAPKVYTSQKTEEYLITAIFAQGLLYNQIPVIGVKVCDDDSNKKADSVVQLESGKVLSVQVTRFTLTEYLKRRKISENKVDKIIREIKKIGIVEFPINVKFDGHNYSKLLPNSFKINRAVANCIYETISNNINKLTDESVFVNEEVKDLKIKEYLPYITLQRLPKGSHSNYYGRDNVFIDLDFDNVTFDQNDIEDESLNIYNKKNNGKSDILLIWADSFEVLYDGKSIGESLQAKFKNTSFKEVYFFKFHSRLNFYLNEQIEVFNIKTDEKLYK